MASVPLAPPADGGPHPDDPLAGDFRKFLWLVWRHLNLPDPTPGQYAMAHFLQHGPARSVIQAFRGVGKSWVTSAFVVWNLYRNPQANILVVSASKVRADDFSTFTSRIIAEMPELEHLRPKDAQRTSKIAFDVGPARASHAPSVKSVGITGQITGSRADLVVADDVEVANNSATQLQRDKLAETIKEFDAVLKPGGAVVYLGTPQTEQSIYGLLEDRGYALWVMPARMPDEKQRAKYGRRLAPYVAGLKLPPGSPVDGQRFTDEDLTKRELSYGRQGFALQFMLDTSLADADRYPLKLSDLVVLGLNPERAPGDLVWASSPELVLTDLPAVGLAGDRYHRPAWLGDDWYPYTGSIMAIDPSGRGGDETAYAVVKTLHGRLFLTAAGALPGGYSPDTLAALARVAKAQKVNGIIVEPNFGDGMFNELLKPVLIREGYPVSVEDTERSATQKERRIIDTLEPVMSAHRLVVCRSVIEADYKSTEGLPPEEQVRRRLFYQMTRMTRDRGALAKDDRIDALALAVHYWTSAMARDEAKAASDARAKALKDELTRFVRHVVGRPRGDLGKRWAGFR